MRWFYLAVRKNSVFLTQSLYGDIMKKERISRENIVLAEIPLKIKIFLW